MSTLISLDEVKKHKNSESCWVVIHGDVYDLTKFLSEHPGGEETILEVGGMDGTQSFEDVGHSDDARELMKKYKIGPVLVEHKSCMEDRYSKKKRRAKRSPSPRNPITPEPVPTDCARWKWALVALGSAVVIGVVLNQYLNSK